MKFGNWNVNNNAIEWAGKSAQSTPFKIERGSLLETMMVEEADTSLYKWIIMATGEAWLTEDDLYDFNFAFAFAAGATPDKFSYEIFDNSLEYQFNTLEESEDDDDDDDDDE